MHVLGISAHFHDAACCILSEGSLVAAAEEERFSRIKHDPRMPVRAARWCLKEAGLTIREIDGIAFYEDPTQKLARQLWMGAPRVLEPGEISRRLDSRRAEREIRQVLGYEGPIHFVQHHEAHAASAYYFSGFSESALFTVDGVGEWSTTTYGRADGAQIELFESVDFPDSLGLLYSTLTSYLGFEVNDGEYKVMGLAPYGEPRLTREVRTLIASGGGGYALDLRYFDFLVRERMYSDALIDLFGQPARLPESEILQFHKDVARSLQVVLEEILMEKVHYLHGRVPSENLCMAGGVALNCVANGRIKREGPFRRLFVQPAASDAGGALGAAALLHVRLTGERPARAPLTHVYLGPCFASDDVHAQLVSMPLKTLDCRGDEAGLLAATAERLAQGKVIGWFHGRMEFGPRALGARSILADPRGPSMRDRINALVKKREAFRPFAPAVLEDKAAEHFEIDHASPFMLETCQVRSPLELPAITHVDGSARVQTVSAAISPRFSGLLRAFDRLTGCPILLNTSFNMRDEPIVCTPLEALACFARSQIDCLVLEDFVIDREALPVHWEYILNLVTPTGGGRRAVGHRVYTFA